MPRIEAIYVMGMPKKQIRIVHDVAELKYYVHYLQTDTGITLQEKAYRYAGNVAEYSAWKRAFDDFCARVRADREANVRLKTHSEFSLIVGGEPTEDKRFAVYEAEGETIEASIAVVEQKLADAGVFDLEALRSDLLYTAAIASIVREINSPQQENPQTKIALMVR